jgi:hypothetical protein
MTTDRDIEIRLLRPALAQGKPEWRIYVLCAIFLCCLLLAGSVVVAGSKLTLAISIVPLILPFMVAYAAMLERGIWDSTVLFPAAFAAYNGVLLVRFCSQDVLDGLFYPVRFDSHDFFMGALLSALAAIFVALAWVIWKPGNVTHVPVPHTGGWFTIGIVFYAVGMALYFLQYAMIGGYTAALATDRLERFEAMAEAQSFPYIPFVLTGLVMMRIVGRRRKRQRIAAFVLMAVWCLVVLAQGDRRLVLQAVLAVICAGSFPSLKQGRVRLKYVFLCVAGYAALTIAGQLRAVIPLLASGAVSPNRAYDAVGGDVLLETVKPENTEIGGPFFSVLYNVGNVKHYSWGASYLDTIGAALPRVLYPGRKPSSPSADLANEVHQGVGPVVGWGYSPVAEAYLNFGIVGVCLIAAAWMGFFIVLSRLRTRSWGIVIAAVLSSECINVNRIDFRTVYVESFYCLLAIALAAVAVRLVRDDAFKLNRARSLGWAG